MFMVKQAVIVLKKLQFKYLLKWIINGSSEFVE